MSRSSAPASQTEYRLRLPSPHAGQLVVLRHPARFKWLDAGRRWNKTTLDMLFAVPRAVGGREVLWGAPTYDQVRIGWTEVRRACAGVVDFNESRLEARFPSGGLIRFRSLDDPDNARGFTADDVVLDEAAKISPRAWHEVVRPMLMTTGGSALANGTPNGRNWFWTECMRAADLPESKAWIEVPTVGARIVDGSLVRAPHPMENPRIAWSEIEDLYRTLPERVFRQEILAEFLEDGGGVFRNVDACVRGELQTMPRDAQRRYVMGVDLAKHQDFTVCVVADVLARQVVAFHRWNQMDWPSQKRNIASVAKHWNDAWTFIDSTGIGDVVYDDLRTSGMRLEPYQFTAATVDQLYHNAALMVEQQQVGYPAVPVLLNELKALQYFPMPSGRLKVDVPEGLHKDAAVAFCLCCWGITHATTGALSADAISAIMGDAAAFGGLDWMKRRF